MVEIDEIVCGTQQEILDYAIEKYEESGLYPESTVLGDEYPMTFRGQLNRCKNEGCSMLFFMEKSLGDDGSVNLELKRFRIFIKEEKK